MINGVTVDESAPDEVLLAALDVAYGKSWWAPKVRLVADMRERRTGGRIRRFFLNWNQADGEGWATIPKARWLARRSAPSEGDR